MAALLSPFGHCAEFLNKEVVHHLLAPGMEAAVKYVHNLDENSLKDKVRQRQLRLSIMAKVRTVLKI